MLRENQRKFVDDAKRHALAGKIYFAELPTGYGKTNYVNPVLAIELAEQGKKVVISTYSNQLVREIYAAFIDKHKTESKGLKIGIVIGKDNYCDIKKIDDGFYDFFMDKDKTKKFIKSVNADTILFDDLFEACEIAEDLQKTVKDRYKCVNRDNIAESFDTLDISITNHVFLLSKILRDKEVDYKIIFDEVDRVFSSMEILLTSSFSILRFSRLLKELIDRKIKGTSKFKTAYKESLLILKKFSSVKLVGEYMEPDSVNFKKYANALMKSKKIHFDKKQVELLKNINAVDLLSEYNELMTIINNPNNDVTLYYSPVKGYPTIHYLKADIGGTLHNQIWMRVNGCVGISATITPLANRFSDKERNFLFYKLGLMDKIFEDIRVLNLSNKSSFKKTNAKIYLPDETAPKNNGQDGIIDKVWIKYVSNVISQTHGGANSLVLVGSFDEANSVFEHLKALPVNIIKATPNRSVASVVNEFKEKGGILIGTRNYSIGIDLPGKLLEKVYIAKFLFPVMNTRYMLDMQKKYGGGSFEVSKNEMYMSLRQSIGRLLRTETDKGEIYVLDPRVHEQKYSNAQDILKNYGVIQTNN